MNFFVCSLDSCNISLHLYPFFTVISFDLIGLANFIIFVNAVFSAWHTCAMCFRNGHKEIRVPQKDLEHFGKMLVCGKDNVMAGGK